ncbi:MULTISPECIES: septation protein IspZ [Acinetobacter]|uniref:septation protein IspZ n=1 Tax=Acinetobacter TaxID=469 RepID=UPI00051BB66C|nr:MULTISPECIES: septation protein IspZ [Acinetobacter]MCH7339233.1 septation protein IspZ [Acinetobacter higginsii]MCH7378929.1 septation protein IspZ [Acinetobacter higginsii]MCJ0830099.1 septation protein IspZ [Acinetobacter sp. NIPH1876]
MRHLIRGGLITFFVLYPFIVGWSLSHGQFIWVSILLIVLGVSRLLSAKRDLMLPLTGLAIICGGLSLILKDHAWLKLYPVGMSLGALIIFALTLYRPPSMIERFARLVEPDLPASGVVWTRKVTVVWCFFFAINAMIALATVFAPMKYWIIYNGFVSYLLMGILFLGEYILRKKHQRLNQTAP